MALTNRHSFLTHSWTDQVKCNKFPREDNLEKCI